MESIGNENHYNGHKEYNISIIQEANKDVITTISEIQSDRNVAVYRVNHGKTKKSPKKLIEQAKATTLIFPHLIPPL